MSEVKINAGEKNPNAASKYSSNPHMHQVPLNHVQSNQELNLQNAISMSQTVGFTSG
jgi:hypothetical protein